MRMWMVSPSLMCRKHLLGEHGEIHKHRHNFVKKHSISGRIANNGIEPESMCTRHDDLAREMLLRGFNHMSDFEQPDLSYLSDRERYYRVDRASSYSDLVSRCPDCLTLSRANTIPH